MQEQRDQAVEAEGGEKRGEHHAAELGKGAGAGEHQPAQQAIMRDRPRSPTPKPAEHRAEHGRDGRQDGRRHEGLQIGALGGLHEIGEVGPPSGSWNAPSTTRMVGHSKNSATKTANGSRPT